MATRIILQDDFTSGSLAAYTETAGQGSFSIVAGDKLRCSQVSPNADWFTSIGPNCKRLLIDFALVSADDVIEFEIDVDGGSESTSHIDLTSGLYLDDNNLYAVQADANTLLPFVRTVTSGSWPGSDFPGSAPTPPTLMRARWRRYNGTNLLSYFYFNGTDWILLRNDTPSFEPNKVVFSAKSYSGNPTGYVDINSYSLKGITLDAPVLENQDPLPGAIDATINTTIDFDVVDNNDMPNGVDSDIDVEISLNFGPYTDVYTSETNQNGYVSTISNLSNGKRFSIASPSAFTPNDVVLLRVTAKEDGFPLNTASRTYSFTVEKTIVPIEDEVQEVFDASSLRVLRHFPDCYTKTSNSQNYKLCKAMTDPINNAEAEILQWIDNQTTPQANTTGLNDLGNKYSIPRAPGMTDGVFRNLIQVVNRVEKGVISSIKAVIDAYFGKEVATVYDIQNPGIFSIPKGEIWVAINNVGDHPNALYVGLDTFRDGNPTYSGLISPVFDRLGLDGGLYNDHVYGNLDFYILFILEKIRPQGSIIREVP